MENNASRLYKQIQENPEQTQALFRQALQDPQGALQAICEIGDKAGLPVTVQEIKTHLMALDSEDTKQWFVKARGGL